jgi:hypothetical protein
VNTTVKVLVPGSGVAVGAAAEAAVVGAAVGLAVGAGVAAELQAARMTALLSATPSHRWMKDRRICFLPILPVTRTLSAQDGSLMRGAHTSQHAAAF